MRDGVPTALNSTKALSTFVLRAVKIASHGIRKITVKPLDQPTVSNTAANMRNGVPTALNSTKALSTFVLCAVNRSVVTNLLVGLHFSYTEMANYNLIGANSTFLNTKNQRVPGHMYAEHVLCARHPSNVQNVSNVQAKGVEWWNKNALLPSCATG